MFTRRELLVHKRQVHGVKVKLPGIKFVHKNDPNALNKPKIIKKDRKKVKKKKEKNIRIKMENIKQPGTKRCVRCDLLISRKDYKSHLRDNHFCTLCNRVYSQENMDKHYEIVHNPNSKRNQRLKKKLQEARKRYAYSKRKYSFDKR